MRRFEGECEHFSFNTCLIYTHDGASAKFSTNSHETDNSVQIKKFLLCFWWIKILIFRKWWCITRPPDIVQFIWYGTVNNWYGCVCKVPRWSLQTDRRLQNSQLAYRMWIEVTITLGQKFKKSLLPSPGRIFLSISRMFEKRIILLHFCPSLMASLLVEIPRFLLIDYKLLKRRYQIVNNLLILPIYQPICPAYFVAGSCLFATPFYNIL